MPDLEWDALDFLECLEVVPEVEEDGISYHYEVARSGHRLALSVFPMESFVMITLSPEPSDTPLLELALFVRGGVRRINDKRGDYLEFQDSFVRPSRFWHIETDDLFRHGKLANGVTLQLDIKPNIRLRFV